MNEHEKARIAAAVNDLRPDWPTQSVRTLLDHRQLADRPRRDVAVALAWVACESNSATPARVLQPGPWWQAVAVNGTGGAARPPTRDEACTTCGKRPEVCGCAHRSRKPATASGPNDDWRAAREALRNRNEEGA